MHVPPNGPPAPPRLGGPAPHAQPRPLVIDRYLDRFLADVCKNLPNVLPMRCYSPAARGGGPTGEQLLHDGAAPPPVSRVMAERLLSALASLRNANDAARHLAESVSVREFRTKSEPEQIAFINSIWNAAATTHPFRQIPAKMFDPPGADTAGRGPLPTSLAPISIGGAEFRKRLAGRQPFNELGIGFRVDGSDAAAVGRILGQGMTQQRLSAPFMLNYRGLRIDGTVLADSSVARVWTLNHDIFNESAVCVSRNFFGATAFPERETKALCYLWAVDCSALRGFDTEGHQLSLRGSRQWRPGEKAFHSIPASRVLGYVQINRLGAPAGGGWSFSIARDANWILTGSPTVKQRVYIEDELAAWRGGSYTIPASHDFAT